MDRILLLNLKDNMLSDLSCKVLGALVEKSKSLRMLDLRGNFISATGILKTIICVVTCKRGKVFV